MPEAEAEYVRQIYTEASVILEYGSGGSTELAASLDNKLVFSVESDRQWSRNLQAKIAASGPHSRIVLHHVDIGATGPWGRPLDETGWRNYIAYPNSIWDKPYFVCPDVILIDGRFRTACLAVAMLRTTKTVRVLFDDYSVRPLYARIEKVIKPKRLIGRMAEFIVEPDSVQKEDMGTLLSQFSHVTIHGAGEQAYQI